MVINNLNWAIKYSDFDDEDTLGYTDFTKLEISIKPNLKDDVEHTTIMHELVHAYCESYSYMYCRDSVSYEQLCEFIGLNFKALNDLYLIACEELFSYRSNKFKREMEEFQKNV